MQHAQETAVLLHPSLRERRSPVGAAVVESRPLTFVVPPHDEVPAEKLRQEMGREREGGGVSHAQAKIFYRDEKRVD